MTSQIRIQIITIHMFPNISRSKDNHAMKFCQLIKYNKGYFFLQKITQKMNQRA